MTFYYLAYIIILIYVVKVEKRALHMLQQNLYNENNRYIRWTMENKKTTVLNFSLFSIIFVVLLALLNVDLSWLFFAFIYLIYIFSIMNEKAISSNNQNKKPLVYTQRIKRLMCTLSIIYLVLIIIPIIDNSLKNIFLLLLCLVSSLSFVTTFIALIINMPIEKMVYNHFERLAKTKLKSMKNLKIVGITGSYGKTSCKNVLNDILNIKYNCLATPKSLNTFNGLMITINNQLSKFDEVFIAEMGAYVRGEIKGLCDLVNPKYGIITKIGTAHLKTFGSEENIQKAKMELIEHLPSDGVGVLNKDDEKQRTYKIKNDCKILWVSMEDEDSDVFATNIKTSGKGSTFDCVFRGDKNKYTFETRLLGKHNIYNILSGICLGYELGINVKDLQQAVRRVKPVEHRLEVKKLLNFYQIDDAYNSNPVGAKNALDILSMMPGDKIIVTPGMVELGDMEDELNKEFGKQIADVCDKVILVGEKKTKPIYDGLIEKKYKKENIIVINNVKESFNIASSLKGKKDLYVLYENDLPDTYNE